MSQDTDNGPLVTALVENFEHARHQERQREASLNWYWISWGAVLAYVGRSGEFETNIAANWYMFGFLSIISFATLIMSLKWNAEFANHMAAISLLAKRLGLNSSTAEQEKVKNSPLPYSEFSGYMALPLKVAIPLNVGAWLSIIHVLGFALSTGMFFYGLCNVRLALFLSCGVTFVIGIVICVFMYRQMQKCVGSRLASANREVRGLDQRES